MAAANPNGRRTARLATGRPGVFDDAGLPPVDAPRQSNGTRDDDDAQRRLVVAALEGHETRGRGPLDAQWRVPTASEQCGEPAA